jgi:hypothetical protein
MEPIYLARNLSGGTQRGRSLHQSSSGLGPSIILERVLNFPLIDLGEFVSWSNAKKAVP